MELSEIEFHLRALTDNTNVVALIINNKESGLNQIDVVFEGGKLDTAHILKRIEKQSCLRI